MEKISHGVFMPIKLPQSVTLGSVLVVHRWAQEKERNALEQLSEDIQWNGGEI